MGVVTIWMVVQDIFSNIFINHTFLIVTVGLVSSIINSFKVYIILSYICHFIILCIIVHIFLAQQQHVLSGKIKPLDFFRYNIDFKLVE